MRPKRAKNSLVMLTAGFLVISGCAREPQDEPQGGAGHLAVGLSKSAELNVVAGTTRATETLPGIAIPADGEFSLHIERDASDQTWNWDDFTECPDPLRLEKGDYSATVLCGDIDIEGFDNPVFGGSKPFEIVYNEVTPVTIGVALVNMAVSVAPTYEFAKYFSDYSVEIVRSGESVVGFSKDETRVAYLKPEAFEVKISYTRQSNGKTGEQSFDVAEHIAPCTYHKIALDVNDGAVGGAEIIVSWDDEVEIVPLDPIDVGEI